MLSNIFNAYDAKLFKRLSEDLKFMKYYEATFVEISPEQKHANSIRNRWYERRVARVKKVMEAYHISGSALCDCDY